MGSAVSTIAFPAPPKDSVPYFRRHSGRLYLRPDGKPADGPGEDVIAAIHIRRHGADVTSTIGRAILYSHGNAEDLGQILPYLDRLAEVCAADVVAYDYPGYCDSGGQPSEEGCYRAIDAAYNYLKEKVNNDPSKIVAFGRSIGSGPTVDLVSRKTEIGAMVLQSPIESAIRTVMSKRAQWFLQGIDIFKNYDKAPLIKCPVLLMHGTVDQVVPHHCGKAIHELLDNAKPMEDFRARGHNDIPEQDVMSKIKQFLDGLARP